MRRHAVQDRGLASGGEGGPVARRPFRSGRPVMETDLVLELPNDLRQIEQAVDYVKTHVKAMAA